MAWPLNPLDADLHTEGNQQFIYNRAIGAWDRYTPPAAAATATALVIPQTATAKPSIPVKNDPQSGIFADSVDYAVGIQVQGEQVLRVMAPNEVHIGSGTIDSTKLTAKGMRLCVIGDDNGALCLGNKASGDHVEFFTDNANQISYFSYKAPSPEDHKFVFSSGEIGADPTRDQRTMTIHRDHVIIGKGTYHPFSYGLYVEVARNEPTTVLSVENKDATASAKTRIDVLLGGNEAGHIIGENVTDPDHGNVPEHALTFGIGSHDLMTVRPEGVGFGTKLPKAPVHIKGHNLIIEESQPPLTSAQSGHDGEIRWDPNYIYVHCAGVWKRAALTTW